ncbi:Ketopantoate hydroxymethyltransferase [Candidatus Rubidus massiliensis]|nr:Ketopantoate hydroxymethyltransferase [Candidatus Rubidus massiliensis]
MNNFPEELESKIISLLQEYNLNHLKEARYSLTDRYRERKENHKTFMQSNIERISYLATRMPATYASISSIVSPMQNLEEFITCKSLLDVGAGPGTASWCLANLIELKEITLVEKDLELVKLGKSLMKNTKIHILQKATWKVGNIVQENYNAHDICIASYVLNELSADEQLLLLNKLWLSTNKYLILVEPGTSFGFGNILRARDFLLSNGASILAPCTHSKKCPMQESLKWCHFSTRLQRLEMHRMVKGVNKGFEDEKYSYLILQKNISSYDPLKGRIVGNPQKHSGHLALEICRDGHLEKPTITKKHPHYKQIKKLEWGDVVVLEDV